MRGSYLSPELWKCGICQCPVANEGASYCHTCDSTIDHLASLDEETIQTLVDKATHRRGLITEAA